MMEPRQSSSSEMVEIAPGVVADRAGIEDASSALQAAFDATAPGAVLALPAGTYRVDRPIWISRPMVLTTRGHETSEASLTGTASDLLNSNQFAVLKAGPLLRFRFEIPAIDQELGLLCVRPPDGEADLLAGVEIHHIVLHGNAQARFDPASAELVCDQFNGANINMQRCRDARVHHVLSLDACPRGNDPYANVFVDTPGLRFHDNLIWKHGENPIGTVGPDYFTTTRVGNSVEVQARTMDVIDIAVIDNRVVDPSNLGIVLMTDTGHTLTGEVARNEVKQYTNMNWGAAILVYGRGSFGDSSRPDPVSTLLVHHNEIDGNVADLPIPGTQTKIRMAPFGIQVGTGPYGPAPDVLAWRVDGVRVYDNRIEDTQVGINIDGAGTMESPVHVYDNQVSGDTGLAFNKAPAHLMAPTGNVIMANEDVLQNGATIEQTGSVRLLAFDQAPRGWSELETHEQCAWGSCASISAVAPKPIVRPVATIASSTTAPPARQEAGSPQSNMAIGAAVTVLAIAIVAALIWSRARRRAA